MASKPSFLFSSCFQIILSNIWFAWYSAIHWHTLHPLSKPLISTHKMRLEVGGRMADAIGSGFCISADVHRMASAKQERTWKSPPLVLIAVYTCTWIPPYRQYVLSHHGIQLNRIDAWVPPIGIHRKQWNALLLHSLGRTFLRPLSVPLPCPHPRHRNPCMRKVGDFHRLHNLFLTLSFLSPPACAVGCKEWNTSCL